ncbi:hypothetical protein [Chamaesiphon sp.]|uniref:hypothetical protein n=1 Tax=Chamaesiphon sp. TaxID=2814140 RepID=UPI0035931870
MNNNDTEAIIKASSEDIRYYSVVRDTIHGLDGIRVSTVSSGISIVLSLFGASIALWQNLTPLKLGQISWPLPEFVGLILAVFGSILSFSYQKKICLFNTFLREAVSIATKIEERIIPDIASRELYALTKKFEQCHPSAGSRGDNLFERTLTMSFYILIALCVFLSFRIIVSFHIF